MNRSEQKDSDAKNLLTQNAARLFPPKHADTGTAKEAPATHMSGSQAPRYIMNEFPVFVALGSHTERQLLGQDVVFSMGGMEDNSS